MVTVRVFDAAGATEGGLYVAREWSVIAESPARVRFEGIIANGQRAGQTLERQWNGEFQLNVEYGRITEQRDIIGGALHAVERYPGSVNPFAKAWLLAEEIWHLKAAGILFIGNAFSNAYTGAAGPDRMRGNGGNDRLYGEAGDDRLDGGTGDDLLVGGRGDDLYIVDSSGDQVLEAAGEGTDLVVASVAYTLPPHVETLVLDGVRRIDGAGNDADNVIRGNPSSNALSGGEGNDRIDGMEGNDILMGGDGDDRLDGGAGSDTMEGGPGDDTYLVDDRGDYGFHDPGDLIVERQGEGADRVISSVTCALPPEVETLVLVGTAAINGAGNGLDNRVIGNGAANTLSGGKGEDVLDGRSGDDVLAGGRGADLLTGGAGADVFRFARAAESLPGVGADRIADLEAADRIDLSAMDARPDLPGRQAFDFIGAAAFSGSAGELRATQGLVAADVDGDGTADVEIVLAGTFVPGADAFLL
jgi:Ca2+-binding RTX toxin-like protein